MIKIDIPSPCHQEWNNMKPTAEGAFCASCNKNLIDFTKKSNQEIENYFLKTENNISICAKLSTSQLFNINFDDFFERFKLWNIFRRIALVIFLVFGLGLFSCKSKKEELVGKVAPNQPLLVAVITVNDSIIDQNPKGHPPGLAIAPYYKEGIKQMKEVIKKNLKYPEQARQNNIEGTVLVMFVISAKGEMASLRLQKKLGYGCDEEAIRIAKLLTEWIPGQQEGVSIDMDFGLEINFSLK